MKTTNNVNSRPKLFIGSSIERIDIANAIQDNLQDLAEVTVWNQGVFELNSNTLIALIEAANEFDFAIFVFHPDDKSEIRNKNYEVVRDNLIFELGLFMGKIGIDNVFYLIPNNTNNFHLPTDLLGITAGTYDINRSDDNYIAATAPFCANLKRRIKDYKIRNLIGFENESDSIKRIVVEAKQYWEVLLALEIFYDRIKNIDKRIQKLKNKLHVGRVNVMPAYKFFDWYSDSLVEIRVQLTERYPVIIKNIVDTLNECSDAIKVKDSVEDIITLCETILQWEEDLVSIQSSEYLNKVKELIFGTSAFMIQYVKQFFNELSRNIEEANYNIQINIKMDMPHNLDLALKEFTDNMSKIAEERINDN